MAIERNAPEAPSGESRAKLIKQLDAVEKTVNRLKLPLYYADQFYMLREHISFVRQSLATG